MRPSMTVLTLVFSFSLAAQSVSDTILQQERAKLHAEHTGEGFDALYLRTFEGVNQAGRLQTRLPGSAFQTSAQPKFVLEEPLEVRVYQSAAVVTGVQAPDGTRKVRFVRVWVRDGLNWRIAIHQGTSISDTPVNATPVMSAVPALTPAPVLIDEEGAVIGVQKALSDAYTQRDADTYERWTAPEFVAVTNTGQVIPREQWFKNNILENREERFASLIDEVKVRIFGDVAVVTFRNISPRPDDTVAPAERRISILARSDGTWKQVLMQSTPIAEVRTAR